MSSFRNQQASDKQLLLDKKKTEIGNITCYIVISLTEKASNYIL